MYYKLYFDYADICIISNENKNPNLHKQVLKDSRVFGYGTYLIPDDMNPLGMTANELKSFGVR